MGYVFAPGVSACLADGRLVILNVRADRYLMAPGETEASLLRLLHCQEDTPGDQALRARLCTNGLILCDAQGPTPALCSFPSPTRSLLDAGWRRPQRRALATAAARVMGTMAELRLRGLAPLLRRAERIRSPDKDDEDAVVRVAAAYAELRLAVRPLDRCLPHSAALALAAKPHHAGVRLVLGVKCYPFGAHAWVQLGPTVLNDRLDTVHAFTPILVL